MLLVVVRFPGSKNIVQRLRVARVKNFRKKQEKKTKENRGSPWQLPWTPQVSVAISTCCPKTGGQPYVCPRHR